MIMFYLICYISIYCFYLYTNILRRFEIEHINTKIKYNYFSFLF